MVTVKDEKEKVKARREKIAGYYLDMSKLAFATTVLGDWDLCSKRFLGLISYISLLAFLPQLSLKELEIIF